MIRFTEDSAALVAELAEGPGAIAGPSSLDGGGAGNGDDDGPFVKPYPGIDDVEPETPEISFYAPYPGQAVVADLSAGVKIAAAGMLYANGFPIKQVEVSFGGSAPVVASLDPAGSPDTFRWVASSPPLTTPGTINLVARVRYTNGAGDVQSPAPTSSRKVTLVNDLPPTAPTITTPASGKKSTLALDFARSCAIRHGRNCIYFAFEMSLSEVTMRLIAAEARIRLIEIRSGQMDDDAWMRMARRMAEIMDTTLLLDSSAQTTLSQLEDRVRTAAFEGDLKLVIVDYLELILSTSDRNRIDHNWVQSVSRRLKLLARELDITVVGVTQIGLQLGRSSFDRPQLSDLKEPGVVNDADVVILLHRPDLLDRSDPRAGEADLIVAKNRNGPTMTVTVASQLHYSRFTEFAPN